MQTSACPVPRSRDTVCRKRYIATMMTDTSQQETVDSVDTVESVDTGDQPLPSSTSDAVTQCYLKPPRWSRDDEDDDNNASVVSDLSWVPEEPMHEEDLFDEEPPYTCDPHHNGIDKFIVCQEELMGLFAICPACCERSDSSIVQQEGTFVKIKQVCASCGYHRFWQNQPMLHRNMPTCNLLLSVQHASNPGCCVRHVTSAGRGVRSSTSDQNANLPTTQALHHSFHGTTPPTQTPAKHSDTDSLPLPVSLTVSMTINHEEN
ncbi:hypothetical protein G5714_023674 [Onychostoma macrolepis]|uniref:Uncharacterized protein n=1 Tax=Onychostoma macrolepis TaxID=369639 RepID=A0A7J6BN04_9TELE|nr:hypothetical protein G5714_023674 [Onychostoma macrolepis]